MIFLIFNCGSSSLTYKVYQASLPATLTVIAHGKAHHVGVQSQEAPYLVHEIDGQTARITADLPDHTAAATEILAVLASAGINVDAVGHRFVHGGTQFSSPVRIDDDCPARQSVFRAMITGRSPTAASTSLARAPVTTTTGESPAPKAIRVVRCIRLSPSQLSNCLGLPNRDAPPAAKMIPAVGSMTACTVFDSALATTTASYAPPIAIAILCALACMGADSALLRTAILLARGGMPLRPPRL